MIVWLDKVDSVEAAVDLLGPVAVENVLCADSLDHIFFESDCNEFVVVADVVVSIVHCLTILYLEGMVLIFDVES